MQARLPNNNKDNSVVTARSFGSMPELLRYIRNNKATLDLQRCDSWMGTKDFTGTKDFPEAVKLALGGWSEGLDKIKSISSKYRSAFTDLFPKQSFELETVLDNSGAYADTGAYIAGSPECMIRFEENEESIVAQNGVCQEIICNVGQRSRLSCETYFYKGAIMLALIEAMELAGFRLQLTARIAVMNNSKENIYNFDLRVKSYSEYLQYDELAFVIANPSFLRRIFPALAERESLEIINNFGFYTGGGYGKVIDHKTDKESANLYLPITTKDLAEDKAFNLIHIAVAKQYSRTTQNKTIDKNKHRNN